MTQLVLPEHTNAIGTIFGGQVAAWIDICGAIAAQRERRRYLYSPVLQREAWLLGESEGLLGRLFGGRVAPLVAHFSQHRKLDPADIAALRKLLEEIDDGKP